jgi:hypothetical protein
MKPTNFTESPKSLIHRVREAGLTPRQSDIVYNYVDRDGMDDLDQKKSMPLKQLSVAFAD